MRSPLVSEDNLTLVDSPFNASVKRYRSYRRRSKLNSSLTFIFAVGVFAFLFLLLFRALNVVPPQINVFWVSEDKLSSININIQFVNEKILQGSSDVCDYTSDSEKFDCFPEGNTDEEKCLQRGCCWKVLGEQTDELPPLGVPYCYYPINYNGYLIQNVSQTVNGFTMKLLRNQSSGYPDDILNAVVNVTYLDDSRLRIKVYDANNQRYEVPVPAVKKFSRSQLSSPIYKVEYDDRNLWVSRINTGKVFFNTSLANLVFANQMLQMSIKLPSHYLYGISEIKSGLLRGTDWKRYVLFTRDRSPSVNLNLYGSHPFYLMMEDDGNSHSVFFLNSNAMEFVTQPTPGITFRSIGGIFDVYISAGPSPKDVVMQYTDLIGRSFMPPYWSLGFHLCRYGYNSVNRTREIWQRTRNHSIPFDTQWNDIDYMDSFNDFTLDKIKFGTLPDFVKEVHDYEMHYIMIVDPGISNAEKPGTYPPYDDGVDMDIFVKNISGGIQVGKVWNKVSTVFPDFTNPKSVDYWTKQLENFHKLIPFDGVWIDMNEPSNFVDGSIYGCPTNHSLESPPYVPGEIEPLRSRTLCMTSKQHLSDHYNVHSLYGLTELIATNLAVKKILQKRPFIITRSTFPGSGHYGGHWDGDIASSWDDMRWTIPSILTLSMGGISMAGADICGFQQNTTVELCARWSALGAFYPFSRNHNSLHSMDQDPVALGEVVISAARNTLTLRYALLPTLYTLFYRSHVYGETVARPMFFEFPNDKATYALDQQFLWGSHILIVPALYENESLVTAYLPKGRWAYYDVDSNIKVLSSHGENFTFSTPLNSTNILIREGGGLVMQSPKTTTAESRKGAFSIYLLMNELGYAETEFYWDDGVSLDSLEKGYYSLVEISLYNNTFTSKPVKKGYQDFVVLRSIYIQEVPVKPSSVKLNGRTIPFDFNDSVKLLIVSCECSLLQSCILVWQ